MTLRRRLTVLLALAVGLSAAALATGSYFVVRHNLLDDSVDSAVTQTRRNLEVARHYDDPNQLVEYGETGRVRLTTLTRETFIPGFLERDEGERERPYERYPWDGVSGVRPFRKLAAQTTVGVY